MSKKKTVSKKDEALFDEELVDHVVTQEDLDLNPELEEEGTKVGDTIQVPKEEEEIEEEEEEEDNDKGSEVSTEDEKAYSGPIPLWARADGVIPSKKDEEQFKTKTVDKPVNREEKLPEYMVA